MKNTIFSVSVIAVTDIEVSKKFYQELFEAEVLHDFGINITFKEGFALQQEFDCLCSINKESMVYKSHTMELCFESFDFDGFLHRLGDRDDIKLVHDVTEYDWKQRVIRFYDPDKHIIEVGESMIMVAKNLLSKGYSEEDTSSITQHPLSFVKMAKEFEVKQHD